MKVEKVLYEAQVSATGGRNGHVVSSDGVIDFDLAVPKGLGGAGGAATNPEQLFASGYSACFLGALHVVAGKEKVKIASDAKVTAVVGIGTIETGGYGLAVKLQVSLPGVDGAIARSLVDKAHQICPYSNATRNNIDVELSVI